MLVVRLFRKILNASRFRRIAGGARRARADHLALLKRAEAERALIRLKSDDPNAKPLYFFLDRVEGERMTLVPRTPKVELSPSVLDEFSTFRMVLPAPPLNDPALFSFRTRVAEIAPSRRSLTLATPKEIKRLERRGNLRLALRPGHMPDFRLTPGEPDSSSVLADAVLVVRAEDSQAHRRLLNLSAGGARLRVDAERLSRRPQARRVGALYTLHLRFKRDEHHPEQVLVLTCALRNVRETGPHGVVELGLQFVSYHTAKDPQEHRVGESGVKEIGRIIQDRQREYYQALKARLEAEAAREAAGT